MTDLVLIHSFPDKMAADLAQETLATHGIKAVPQTQETLAATSPGASAGMSGPVNVFVPREDYERARGILGV